MLEGAIAYFEATGRRRLLDIMIRYVDHIAATFGTGAGPEARLLRPSGDRAGAGQALPRDRRAKASRPRRLFHRPARRAAALFRPRGRGARRRSGDKYYFKTYEYNQSHKPVREQDKVVGHAVRAMYLYAAMADLAAETGDESLKAACERLWKDVTREADVRDGRARPVGLERGLHHRLRPARTTPPMPRPAPRSR